MRTESTRAQSPISVSGSRSFAKPGSMPVVKQEVEPSWQAFSSASTIAGGHAFG